MFQTSRAICYCRWNKNSSEIIRLQRTITLKQIVHKQKETYRWGDCGPLIMFPIFVMIDYDISSRFSEELSYWKETNEVNQYIEMQCYESAYQICIRLKCFN